MIYRQPFDGYYPITLDFGEEYLPLYKKGEHKGIDYGCPIGTPICSAADGIVIVSTFQEKGYGYYILIRHDDNSGTIYAHLDYSLVSFMERVKQGELIGYSGNSGNTTGPHLHFEIRTKADDYKSAIDPKLKLQSVIDRIDESKVQSVPQQITKEGYAKVICDCANVRCHVDPNRIIKQKYKGDEVLIINTVPVMINGLPYYSFHDNETNCNLLIAAYDSYGTQILQNPE